MKPLNVQVQQIDSIPVAVIRRQVTPSEISRTVRECCGLVWNALREQQAQGGRHVAIYWDGSIRLEAGAELFGPFIERDDVVRSATPAGAVASVAYFGPYSGLGTAHNAIRQWCRDNHLTLAGPNWEIYGHWQAEWNTDPSQIRTDIYYQLAS